MTKDKTPAKYPLFNFRADPETINALDRLRRDEPDIPTRSEMARRIIKRAGEQAKSAEKKGKR